MVRRHEPPGLPWLGLPCAADNTHLRTKKEPFSWQASRRDCRHTAVGAGEEGEEARSRGPLPWHVSRAIVAGVVTM